MIPRRVWLAILISFLCHGFFVLTERYRFSYDAYTHMLFANHYAENWFSLWESRWYTGFTVVSYPPLTHQLIALFIPVLGFDKAFALILWLVTTLYPVGVYTFSRIFTGRTASSYAALASAILLPVYVTAYVFGQLPFLASTLFALFGAAGLAQYLREGGIRNFALALSCVAVTMASHHATLIIQPFLLIAVIVSCIDKSNWRTVLSRCMLFGVPAILTGIIVIWPFWQWGTHQVMQTPIDHLSRHSFFIDPLALAIFFFPLYGPLVVVIPFLFQKWNRRILGLLLSFSVLFLLGLGGTTPLPRLFFGAAWEWLTYDRFAFWACLTLTPFFGMLLIRLKYGWKTPLATKSISASLRNKLIPAVTFSIFIITALGVWFQPLIFPTQPKPIDMRPIVNFLEENDNSQWRYLTFGFGNQYTYLNLLTTATTIDGSYHTARTLPELRESGIAEVDTAYWALKGIPAIRPILKKSGEHGVRWGFVNRAGFIPELEKDGWIYRKTLRNGVQVWENPTAIPPEPSHSPEVDPIASFSWGVFPILSLIITLSLSGLQFFPVQTERVIRAVHALAVGLLPISLCFWYYFPIAEFAHPRVYFVYTHALIFLADALVLLVVLLWVLIKIFRQNNIQSPNPKFVSLTFRPQLKHAHTYLFFILSLLITSSTFWSRSWQTSLYISIHFWLIFIFVLSLSDWQESWKYAMFGFCAALGVEVIAGFTGFVLQSTGFLEPLHMKWPGPLDPSVHGASVVQLADGLRILRSYGTLPHPNILGGFAFLALLGPAGLFLINKRLNYLTLILLCLGITLIGLTFSRSAWLGLIAFVLILVLKSKYFERKRLFLFISTIMLAVMLTLYPLQGLVFSRVSNSAIATETISTVGRAWLTQQALEMIRQHPLTGVGVGSFIIELSKTTVAGALIEPVHDVFLLVTSELGVVGFILIVGLFISIALNVVKAKSPQVILAGATLTGLGVISLFDHYLWTLAPGRMMLGLVLALWAGQVAHDA